MTAPNPIIHTAKVARMALMQAVHARAREIGLDPEDRRALQERITGHASCRDMDAKDLRQVLIEMDRLVSRPNHECHLDRVADGPHTRKIWALWLTAWNLGLIGNRSQAALIAFVKRQTGLDAARWAHDTAESAKVVEGLKAWLARPVTQGGGGVNWQSYAGVDPTGKGYKLDNPRARVLEAQWRMLATQGVVRISSYDALAVYAAKHAGVTCSRSHIQLNASQARKVIDHLGTRIRATKAARQKAEGYE